MTKVPGDSEQDRAEILFWAVAVILLGFGAAFIFFATTWGLGLEPDSVGYIRSARNILRDGDFGALDSHWPPLYPLLLAFAGYVTGNVLIAGRYLHILLYVGTLALTGYVLYRQTSGSARSALLGMLLMLAPVFVLHIHALLLSEASYLLLSLAGLYLLAAHLDSRNIAVLTVSAMLVGLAWLTKYVGISLVATGVVAILLFATGWSRKLRDAALFGLVAALPMAGWLARNWLRAGAPTDRRFVYHPVPLESLQAGVATAAEWFFVPEGLTLLLLVPVGIVAALYLRTIRNRDRAGYLCEISLLHVPMYLALLLASISFADAHTLVDHRTLIPVYLYLVVAIVLVLNRVPGTDRFWIRLQGLAFACLVALGVAHLLATGRALPVFIENGIGFANRAWATSDTLQFVRGLPAEAAIYTNAREPIFLYLDRNSAMIPRWADPLTRTVNAQFPTQWSAMKRELVETDGVIVFFDAVTWRWYLPTQARLGAGFRMNYNGRDGQVYSVAE